MQHWLSQSYILERLEIKTNKAYCIEYVALKIKYIINKHLWK